MQQVEVDPVGSEPTQALVEVGAYRLRRDPGQPGSGEHVVGVDDGMTALGDQDDFVSATRFLEPATKCHLALPEPIDVRGVDEVASGSEKGIEQRGGVLVSLRREGNGARPEPDRRDRPVDS